jgi:hypothetical protein
MEGGGGRPQLNGQWKVLLFGGPWKVPLLSGQWKEKEQHLFTSSHFPPNKFYLNLQFFPLTLRSYFTMVLGCYLCIPFLFLDLLITTAHLDVTSPPHLIVDLILIKDLFSFPWNHGIMYGHILRASNCTNEQRIAFGIISRSDPNIASSWWRSWTSRGACSSWN